MPEFPEVKTVIQILKNKILNKMIAVIIVNLEKILKNISVVEFQDKLFNQVIIDIKQFGKNIIFILDDYYLIVHLRMEGKFYYFSDIKDIQPKYLKHNLIQFWFYDKSTLIYHDTRRFGTFHLYDRKNILKITDIPHLQKIGYEPWNIKLTPIYLYNFLHKKNIAIKICLLDQSIIAGIGNIYADEILHLSMISPLRKSRDITLEECQIIIENTKKVFLKSIHYGGTTVFSFQSSHGIDGKFQNYLYAYNQTNKLCKLCKNNKIIKIKISGRGTHYCENCQK